MTKKEIIQKFLSSERIAVAGVSRNNKKFGYSVYKELKLKGFKVIPVNPNLKDIDGDVCYPAIVDIPGKLEALLTVVKPQQTESLVDNIRKDIKVIWMQPGSESVTAINRCEKSGIDLVTGECILMYAEPSGFHKFHRFINKLFGKLAV